MPSSRSRQPKCVSRATAVQTICAFLLLNSVLAKQNPAEKEPLRGQQSGMSTGSAHAPVKDALSRPITAGGFVDGAPVIFIDFTHKAGIDRFHHRSGGPEKRTILETPGSGVALLDYDNDGYLDIFVPGYAKFDPDNPPISGKGGLPAGFCQFRGVEVMCGPRGLPGEGDHLFHNNGDGTFTDVSVKAGVADAKGYYGFSSAFVDVDEDAWVDMAVANHSLPK